MDTVERFRGNELKTQLFLRAVAGGVLSERDRLFEYTTGEAYQEMNLYLADNAQKAAAYNKLKEKGGA